MDITGDFVKEVAAFADQNNKPLADNPPVIIPASTTSADAPPSTEPAKTTAEKVDTKPEAVITPPADAPVELSEEQTNYLTSIATPTQHGKEEIQKESPKPQAEKEKILIPKEIEDDNFIQDYLEVKRKGGDVTKFIKESFSDIEELSPQQVMERRLAQLQYTPEQITEAVEKTFAEGTTKFEQDQIVSPLREALKNAQSEKAKKYKANLPDNSASIEQEKLRVKEVNQKAISDLDALKDKMVGKSKLGLPIDDEKWQKIDNYIRNEASFAQTFPILDNQGRVVGFDVDEAANYAAFKLFQNEIASANVALGEIKGYNKMYSQRKRVSEENTQTGTVVSEETLDGVMERNFNKK